MTLDRYEALLKDSIGLDTASIGCAAIERAVRERTVACGARDAEAYWLILSDSAEERQELIESVVVPETWFFRDREAFAALARFVLEQWIPRRLNEGMLRVLSIPCSTGEEPYSIAMTLLDAGVPPSRFAIDAVDISARALAHAEAGVYRRNSFRGTDLEFRTRYFETAADAHRLAHSVRERVQFRQSNLFGSESAREDASYDIVFCRNLLIYFDRPTQDRAVQVLARLLAKEGVLFVGPSETGLMLNHDFASASWPRAFAFRKSQPVRSEREIAPAPCGSAANTVARFAPAAPPRISGRQSARTVSHLAKAEPRQASAAPRSSPNVAAHSDAPSMNLLQQAEQFANQGDTAAARRCCDTFIRERGGTAQAFYLMGLLDDSAGNAQSAAEQYRRVLYLDPHHHEALVHLAMLVDRSGDVAGARRLFERARRASARGSGT